MQKCALFVSTFMAIYMILLAYYCIYGGVIRLNSVQIMEPIFFFRRFLGVGEIGL